MDYAIYGDRTQTVLRMTLTSLRLSVAFAHRVEVGNVDAGERATNGEVGEELFDPPQRFGVRMKFTFPLSTPALVLVTFQTLAASGPSTTSFPSGVLPMVQKG